MKAAAQYAVEGFVLSPQQKQAWRRMARGTAESLEAVIRIDGTVTSSALLDAVRSLIVAHEIFRTRFVSIPGLSEPVQVIADLPLDGFEATHAVYCSVEEQEIPAGYAYMARDCCLIRGQWSVLLWS